MTPRNLLYFFLCCIRKTPKQRLNGLRHLINIYFRLSAPFQIPLSHIIHLHQSSALVHPVAL